ncbi:hydrogenase accessory protein [Rhodopseudomonas sp. P1]|uniref:hydrogenase accessory protein n=1 Tax=Rhodopseudomonas sp. P1 TaxID=3434357 RepID=UPI0031FD552B
MSGSLARAAARPNAPTLVDEANVDDFIACSGKIVVLFFRGDAARFPEAADLAVVLPELINAFPGRLVAAEVAAEAERGLMAKFGVAVCPSLAVVQPERTLGVIAKIQDWSSYLAQIGAMLAEVDQRGEAELQS